MWNVFHVLGGTLIENFRQLVTSFVFSFGLYEYEGLFSEPSESRLRTAKQTDFNPREL